MTSRFPTLQEMATWPEPNYINPDTMRAPVMGVTMSMIGLVVIFMSCRIYSRTVIVYVIGLDDWIMLAAAVIFIAKDIMSGISTLPNFQTGYHIWDMKPEILYGVFQSGKIGMAAQLMFIVVVSLTKFSILLTYLRIFPSKTNKWFCWFMMGYTFVWNFAFFFIVLFQCSPIDSLYKYMTMAKCLDVKAVYYTIVSQNTLSDFLIFLWPARELMSVKISLRQRITLICMFSLGVIISVVGVVRVYYTYVYLESYDIFWHAAEQYIVTSIESALGIACGCLPGCKPLMSRLMPQVFGTTQGSSNNRPTPKTFGSKKLFSFGLGSASSTQPQSGSFNLKSLNSGGEGIIIKREDLKQQLDYVKRPEPPRRQSRVSIGRAWRGNTDSRSSEEFIILQDSAGDEDYKKKYMLERWV